MAFDPGGVAACSRWWSALCDTTGSSRINHEPRQGFQHAATPAGVGQRGLVTVVSPRTLVFCHRIANDSWKRSFSFQCCEISYVCTLNSEDIQQVETLLLSDKKLLKAFEKYQATKNTIDLVGNLALGGFSDREVEQFPDLCNEMLAARIDDGVTLDDVLILLRQRGLDSHMSIYPAQVTLQLVSVNHELRNDEFVFRRYRVLKY